MKKSKNFYDKETLDSCARIANLINCNLVETEAVPKEGSGKTIEFRKYNSFPKAKNIESVSMEDLTNKMKQFDEFKQKDMKRIARVLEELDTKLSEEEKNEFLKMQGQFAIFKFDKLLHTCAEELGASYLHTLYLLDLYLPLLIFTEERLKRR